MRAKSSKQRCPALCILIFSASSSPLWFNPPSSFRPSSRFSSSCNSASFFRGSSHVFLRGSSSNEGPTSGIPGRILFH